MGTDPVLRGAPERVTVSTLLLDARNRLRGAGMAEPDLDARLLAQAALGLDAAAVVLRGDENATDDARTVLAGLLERRMAGEPVHRILGKRAFYDHDFALSSETLEPRPDTEVVVDLCRRPIDMVLSMRGRCLLADVGTGTGAIAVSLLALFPAAEALAIDIAPGALATARANARAAGVADRFTAVACDYLSAIAGPLDLVVSNPPYIPSGDIEGLSREVRNHDPRLALDGGPDGLAAYRVLAAQSACLLRPCGHAVVEIGQGQASDVGQIFLAHGLVLAATEGDLSGATRALWFRRPD